MKIRLKNVGNFRIALAAGMFLVIILPLYILIGSVGEGVELGDTKRFLFGYYKYTVAAIFVILILIIAVTLIKTIINKEKSFGITTLEFHGHEVNATSEDYLKYEGDNSFLSTLPGFRRGNNFRKIISCLYFIMAFVPILDRNYMTTILLISLPFVIFDIFDAIHSKKSKILDAASLKHKLVRKLAPFVVLFIAMAFISVSLVLGSFQSRFASNIACRIPDVYNKLGLNVEPTVYYDIGIFLEKNNALPYLKKGNFLFTQGTIKEAEDNFKKALILNPENYEVYFQLGELYSGTGEKDKALSMFDTAELKKPTFAPSFYEASKIILERGDTEQAEKLADIGIKLDSQDFEAFRVKAYVMSAKKDYNGADLLFDQAIKIKPDMVELYRGKAENLLKAGNFDEALVSIQKCLSINANDTESNYDKGLILLKENEFKDAASSFNKALALDEGYSLARCKLATTALFSGDIITARAEIKKALQSGSDIAEVHFANSGILLETGDYTAALDEIERALQIDGLQPEYYSMKAEILLKTGRIDKVEDQLEKAFKIDNSSDYSYYAKGNYLTAMNDFEGAESAYKKATELNPYFSRAYAAMALVTNAMNDRAGADELIEKALELCPDDYYNFFSKSQIYFNRRLDMTAMDSINKAIEINGNLAELYIQKYWIQDALGLNDDKAESLAKAEGINENLYSVKLLEAIFDKDDKNAITTFDDVIALSPGNYNGFLYKAQRLMLIGKTIDAVPLIDEAIKLNGQSYRSYLMRFNILQKADLPASNDIDDEEIKTLDNLIAVNKYFADAHFFKGVILAKQAKYEDAADEYNKALGLEQNSYLNTVNASEIYGRLSEVYNALSYPDKADEAQIKMERAKRLEALENQ